MRRPLLALLLLAGCGPEITGSGFGHFEVIVESAKLDTLPDPLTVKVGGIAAYKVERLDARRVKFTVQGHPEPGTHPVVIGSLKSKATLDGGFVTYQAP